MKKLDTRGLPVTLVVALLLGGCASMPAAPPRATQTATADIAATPTGVPLPADAARLIPLQGALNVRTLGALRGSNGPIPADSFVRAADVAQLTPADLDALAARGVVLRVDLRTAEEAASGADPFATDSRFKYARISLLGTEKLDLTQLPDSLGVMYVQSLAANQPQYKQVFETIAGQPDGTVLFHCTAGKDRTGMISAMLLSLAGVPRRDIVHNYTISAHYLEPMLKRSPQIAEMVRQNPKIANLMGTPPEAIESFLDVLDREHGGARAYLEKIGVSDADVQQLMVRMGQASRR
jgi:protein-tyrosine phosphatase